MAFLGYEILDNPIWRWLIAVGILIFVGLIFRVLLRLTVRRLRKIVIKTSTRFDDLVVDLLQKTRLLFILIVSLYVSSIFLTLPELADSVLSGIFIVAFLLQAGYWGNAFVEFWIRRTVKRRLAEDAGTATTMSALGFVAKMVIWAIVILVALDMFMDVTALIAGLGIGGIAIALAVQNILSDLFASVSIIVDKPFVIGDFIIVGDQMGNVEKIGLKTTRVRSLTGEQIIFSNSDLLSSRVRNYRRMYERRIAFSIGVTYQTSSEQLEQIPGWVEDIITRQPDARFDRCHFKSFEDFALAFEIVYFVLVPDYAVYMDIQQNINLGILRAFSDHGVEFAYPTQTLFVQRDS
ncbi:mechanosensitive ion channel family protein, partial [Candidatus Bipolaricaulota bacterium]